MTDFDRKHAAFGSAETTPEQATSAPIDPGAEIGVVALTVRDLDRSLAFYRERLGFASRESGTDREARLGAGGRDLLVLEERPDAPVARGAAGLYHFAVLVPSRRDLAFALRQLLVTGTQLTGASDHGVSEALYLSDAEGNGIEIYRDRPRAEWPLTNGQLAMMSDPLDLEGILAEIAGHEPAPAKLAAGTRIGHVHLHVSHLAEAVRFYEAALGMDLMQHLGRSAAFLSAGGYHHHIGLNTWAGEGAPPPPEGAAGLRDFEIVVSTPAEVERVAARARTAGAGVESARGEAIVMDPSQHRIRIVARERANLG